MLEVITHGSRGDIVDVYSSLPWTLLCEEIAKFSLTLPACPAATPDDNPAQFATALATGDAEDAAQIEQRPGTVSDSGPFEFAGWTGLEPAASGVTGRRYNQLNYHPLLTSMIGGTGIEPVTPGL